MQQIERRPMVPISRADRMEEKIDMLLRGQADLTVAFGKIWRRVDQLEQDAQWKKWVMRVGKAAVPFVTGVVAAKWPAVGTALAEVVKAVGGK